MVGYVADYTDEKLENYAKSLALIRCFCYNDVARITAGEYI